MTHTRAVYREMLLTQDFWVFDSLEMSTAIPVKVTRITKLFSYYDGGKVRNNFRLFNSENEAYQSLIEKMQARISPLETLLVIKDRLDKLSEEKPKYFI